MNEVIKQVSETVTESPVVIEVDIKPRGKWHSLLQKWRLFPKKKELVLNPITYGNLIRISTLLNGIDMSMYQSDNLLESNYKAMQQHGPAMVNIVAIALYNRKKPPGSGLTGFIEENFTAKEMLQVITCVVKQMDVTSFMISITSIKAMNVLERSPASAISARKNEVSL